METLINEGAFTQDSRLIVNRNFTALDPATTIKRIATDVAFTSNATLADLGALSHDVVPGTYAYRVVLQTTATANGGTKVAFKQGGGATLTSLQNQSLTATATANASTRVTSTTDAASLVAATAANLLVILEGTMVVATAGTITVQGAQNASHGDTTTYHVGSTFKLERIA